MEFCNQYVTFCQEENSDISANGFLLWMGNIENEFIDLLYQLTINFALAIYTQKQGIQCNDFDKVNAGRYKFMPFFMDSAILSIK